LQGSIPEGKAPIGGPVLDIPIVVEEPDAWSAWGEHAVGGWDFLAGTDTTDHNAYQVTGGATLPVAMAEDAAWRSADAGQSQAMQTAANMSHTERNENTVIGTPFFGDGGSIVTVQRQIKAGPVNNPDGIPGHTTPKVTVRNQRKFPTPHRTHDEYSSSKVRVHTATTTRPVPGDRYGSPFISSANAIAYPAGPRQPAMYTYPGLWDQNLAAGNTAIVDGQTNAAGVIEPGTETGWDNGF
jgi:hypothetical protein